MRSLSPCLWSSSEAAAFVEDGDLNKYYHLGIKEKQIC